MDKVERYIKGIVEEFEGKTDRLKDTPKRASKAYRELLDGYKQNPDEVVGNAIYQSRMDDIVIMKNISFESFCEHHMIAVTGYVSVGYIPNGTIVGASKLARIVDCFSHRFQLQERLTMEIADAVQNVLNPKGVAVYVSGKHFCISKRGVKKQEASLTTRYFLGEFKQNAALRNEFLTSVAF
ncbi:MAG: GTP cyclohydrolase I FolE [Holosporales bacterium]|jgi:GTP cyclohydrolase I|nr:GTP cyclohydrolase I FolE [Holosporales bacterium]